MSVRLHPFQMSDLKLQKASFLSEPLALSRDKKGIRKLAQEGQVIVKSESPHPHHQCRPFGLLHMIAMLIPNTAIEFSRP